MGRQLTAEDAKMSLTAHLVAKGGEIREKYGSEIGWSELLRILDDRSACRYPCEIVFDAQPLQEGEFAFPMARGELPEDGFTLFIHPFFQAHLDRVPCLVLFQLVVVNYGEFASELDAETFGAAALGISNAEYYQLLCTTADMMKRYSGIGCCCH
ncbi:MAG: hypothetical protein D4R65_06700 [Verrucomicrobiaceae bacterium]|nr:MAG: hypothetical protein D4R65_06700 [Verrucomicrobiaceae bacterium]